MSFVGGILSFNSCLVEDLEARFNESLLAFREDFPWPMRRIEDERYILVCADTYLSVLILKICGRVPRY